MHSSTYRLELIVDGGASTRTEIFVRPADVQTFLAQSLGPDSILIVTHLKHDADYGNFVIFLNAIGLAYVRVLEHRGFYAARPDATAAGRTVQFVDDGSTFDVDENSTLPIATALDALNHWLASGERFPNVCWIDE